MNNGTPQLPIWVKRSRIYTDLGDREMVGRSFTDLTDALSGLAASRKQPKPLGADSLTFRRMLTRTGHACSLPSGRPAPPPGNMNRRTRRSGSAEYCVQLSDPKLEAGLLGARSIVNFALLSVERGCRRRLPQRTTQRTEAYPWQRALQLRILHQSLLYLGRLEEAASIADVLEPLARKIGANLLDRALSQLASLGRIRSSPGSRKLETGLRQISKAGREEACILASSLREYN